MYGTTTATTIILLSLSLILSLLSFSFLISISMPMPPIFSLLLFFFIIIIRSAYCTTFTFVNNCDATIWPGTLTNAGSSPLNPTGFELQPGKACSFQAPTGWSGRFWARTGCNFDATGRGSCSTGDCGSGEVECNGAGAAPPATLAEFTLAGPSSGKDFYDVSLVDGYNLPMMVESGSCGSTGCAVDLNRRCPAELRVGEGSGEACRSACEAFGKPEFCCSGAYATPATCRPSVYSEMFKLACPKSYSYAYDDATSTFTCAGGDYTVTFCPDSSTSQKSSRKEDPTSATNYPPPKSTGGVIFEDNSNSWLASLALGDAPPPCRPLLQHFSLLLVAALSCILLIFQVL